MIEHISVYDSKHKHFEELLKSWINLSQRYYSVVEDITTWYTEAASVSLLNSAAFNCTSKNWVGLQEFQEQKTNYSRGRKKKLGRADLFLMYANQSVEKSYICEAKIKKLDLSKRFAADPEKLYSRIEKLSETAWWSADQSHSKHYTDTLSITFFDIHVKTSLSDDRMAIFLDALENGLHFDMNAAWILKTPFSEDEWSYFGSLVGIDIFSR